jgi:hypothetical protein
MLELRRFSGLLFVALYLAGSAKLTIAKHFCGGELVSIAFEAPPSCCGDGEDAGCCENEETVIAHDEHSYSLTKFLVKPSNLIDIWDPTLILADLAQAKSTCSFTLNHFYLYFKPPPLRWFIIFRSLVI